MAVTRNPLRRSPSDTGSDLTFGPGGQIKIVSDSDSLYSTDVSQNQAPQTVQSTAAFSQISQSQASQPLLTSRPPEQTVSAILSIINVPAGTSVVHLASGPSPLSLPTPSSALPSTPVVSPLSVSSTPASSAAETTAPATTVSSEAALPSTSTTVASTGHSSSFYVGIVTGIIIIIACLAALVAWWIRMRQHARRRRLADEVAGVPWAKPGNNDPLRDNQEVTFIDSGNLSAVGVAPSSQTPMAWEPRGDRDVGEPKRTESFLNGSVSPTKPPAVPYNPFATQFPAPADNASFHLPLYNTYAKRQLPSSHLPRPDSNLTGSVDGHASIASLGPLQVANRIPGDVSVATSRAPSMLGVPDDSTEFGTPHVSMAGSRPRFLGLEGGGLRVPWAPRNASFSRSPTSMRGGHGAGNWEHLPSLPMPGASNGTGGPDAESWTASLKVNLMNAFNAVAAGLPSAPTMEERQENYLTPCPPRHASHVGSLYRADRGDLSDHRLTRESTASSKVWTLEERTDGTGTVRFYGLEGYRGGDHAFSPMPPESSVTLQDEGRSDIGGSIFRMTTHESQTPLIINRKPKTAVLRPGFYGRISQYGYGRKPGLVSRASSVYSTMSGRSSVNVHPNGRGSNLSRESAFPQNGLRLSSPSGGTTPSGRWSEKYV